VFMCSRCKWHALERSEQAKYYEMARKEKELHMQLYPGWSARDNYATRTKKKKMKRDVSAMTSNYESKLGIFSELLILLFCCRDRPVTSIVRCSIEICKKVSSLRYVMTLSATFFVCFFASYLV